MTDEAFSVNDPQVKFAPFGDVYDPAQYVDQPLPFDIYSVDKVLRAKTGQRLNKERLLASFVLVKDAVKTSVSGQKNDNANAESKEVEIKKTPQANNPSTKTLRVEEDATQIEKKLEEIPFTPFPPVKIGLKKNIYNLKEIFKKNMVNGVLQDHPKQNRLLSENIANFYDGLLDNSLYAQDYIEMVNGIRTPDNYVSFSHPCAVSFYSLAIAKKLKMIAEDIEKNNYGRWLPVKTAKVVKISGAVSLSNQLLKYTDRQKDFIKLKYDKTIAEKLTENLHNFLHEYSATDFKKSFPSLSINFQQDNLRVLTMAAVNADLGMTAISSDLLNKADSLSPEEYETFKSHPVLSINIIKEVYKDTPKVLSYILGHHCLTKEQSYPQLPREPFPESKIIAICDIYDAVRSPRNYGKHHNQAEAFEVLKELYQKGAFDPVLYIVARHTFEEYNHEHVKARIRQALVLN